MSLIIGIDRPTVPAWIEREILKMGGKNPLGGPLYRIVWGASKVLSPGEDHYDPERWHLEKWSEGAYHHAYRFGYCPHMKEGETKWCKACYLSGGEVFALDTHFQIIERVVSMFVQTERLQKSSLDKGAKMERDALMEREKKAEEERGKKVREMVTGNLSAIDRVPHSISPRASKTLREVDMPLHSKQVRRKGKPLPDPGDFKQI